jgi:uncharacterized protein with NRDE domain
MSAHFLAGIYFLWDVTMCLILLALKTHPRYPFILAANRDEFYHRPTAAAAFWEDAPQLLAGRDLVHGGTWLGVTTGGRIAALTNYRDPHAERKAAPSRGELVRKFLSANFSAEDYRERQLAEGAAYNGYNLLWGDPDCLYCYSNKSGQAVRLTPGIHGLSNHLLDTPWPKVVRGREALAQVLKVDEFSPEDLLAVLADRNQAPDELLPDTGVGLELERLLSSIFIASEHYGTRSSTVVLVDSGGRMTFVERSFNGARPTDVTVSFDLRP